MLLVVMYDLLKFTDFNNLWNGSLLGVSERKFLFPLHSCISLYYVILVIHLSRELKPKLRLIYYMLCKILNANIFNMIWQLTTVYHLSSSQTLLAYIVFTD